LVYNASEGRKLHMSVFTKQIHAEPVMFVLAPILLLTWGYFAFFTGTPSPERVSKPHELTAIELHVQAQQFVKQTLKAPTTAEFPWDPVSAGTDGTGLYQVESYVDSQNSFGAMVRSEWMVNMRLSGDRWTLEKMRIGGKIVYDAESDNTK